MKHSYLLLLGLIAGSSPVAFASPTTPNGVLLSATFQCISVKAPFSGDTNANNSAAIQFRRTGTTNWFDAYPPIIDRRATVDIMGSANDNVANRNQARGSIVGLGADTSYEVRVAWSDPDGIPGNAAVTNMIRTLSYLPPAGGTTRYVDASASSEGNGSMTTPFKTITNAIARSNPGDTILVGPGRYNPVVISRSGTASNYFILRTNGPGASIKGGAAVNYALQINASYWVVDGFNIEQSFLGGIHFNSGSHHVYVQNTVQTNAVANTGNTTCAAVELYGILHDIYLLTNTWATYNPQITNNTDGVVDLIDLGGGPSSTLVIADNKLAGGWDAIGNRLNSGLNGNGENCDFCRNVITNWVDDLIELDGLGPNVRFFENKAQRCVIGLNGYGGSLLSDCGTYIGPAYVFRNALRGWYTNATGGNVSGGIGLKLGNHSSVGVTYYFHNTIVTTSSGGGHEATSEGYGVAYAASNKVYRCNIFVAAGNVHYRGGPGNQHDYNLGYSLNSYFADTWAGSVTYPTFGNFQVGTGQESHGLSLDPLLNPDLSVPAVSAAIDRGLVLANFNDQGSAWPFDGNAPDFGASEYNPSPLAPAGLRILSPP